MSTRRLILCGGTVQEIRVAARMAQESGAQVRLADDAREALAFARADGADLLIAELSCQVPRLIDALRRERIGIPVLACGVDAPASLAVEAVKAGALDFLPLPPSRELIAAALLSIGRHEVRMIGADPSWTHAIALAERLLLGHAPLLLVGPPGSGKRLLADHLHCLRGVAAPLVSLDASRLESPAHLVSELFGHRAGAFDGAVADRPGKIAESADGTLVVQRVELLPSDLQRALVEAMRSRRSQLIATAHGATDLDDTLSHWLSAGTVHVPALAGRSDDIGRLAIHFSHRFTTEEGLEPVTFPPDAAAALAAYDWPGNVRELEEVVHRAVILSRGGKVAASDLVLRDGRPLGAPELPVGHLIGRSVDDVERALILGTLARCGGNRTSASAILGISVRTMRNKLRALRTEGVSIAPAA